jgi:RNA polymerase sigma factor (TIGR02999 family)
MASQRPGHTLQTTGLVNEVYLRLVNVREATWQDRAHFFAVCAKVMRRILIDSERRRRYQKRGAGAPQVSMEDALAVSQEKPAELLAVDDALSTLASVDPRKAKVVEFRFYGGLSVKETAAVLKVSEETVHRDWRLAKLWLLRELSNEKANRT